MDKVVRVGIGVFIIKNGKFLMGKRRNSHGDGTWSVPGGHLEFGESIEKGAAREAFEETGLRVKDIKIAGIGNDFFKKEDKHYITIWVTTHWKSGKEKIKEPDKFIEMDWYNFRSLPKHLFLPWKQLFKSDFIKDIKKEVSKT